MFSKRGHENPQRAGVGSHEIPASRLTLSEIGIKLSRERNPTIGITGKPITINRTEMSGQPVFWATFPQTEGYELLQLLTASTAHPQADLNPYGVIGDWVPMLDVYHLYMQKPEEVKRRAQDNPFGNDKLFLDHVNSNIGPQYRELLAHLDRWADEVVLAHVTHYLVPVDFEDPQSRIAALVPILQDLSENNRKTLQNRELRQYHVDYQDILDYSDESKLKSKYAEMLEEWNSGGREDRKLLERFIATLSPDESRLLAALLTEKDSGFIQALSFFDFNNKRIIKRKRAYNDVLSYRYDLDANKVVGNLYPRSVQFKFEKKPDGTFRQSYITYPDRESTSKQEQARVPLSPVIAWKRIGGQRQFLSQEEFQQLGLGEEADNLLGIAIANSFTGTYTAPAEMGLPDRRDPQRIEAQQVATLYSRPNVQKQVFNGAQDVFSALEHAANRNRRPSRRLRLSAFLSRS